MIKIAAVQLNLGIKHSNLINSIKKYLEKGKRKNVDIICFPESTLNEGPKKK